MYICPAWQIIQIMDLQWEQITQIICPRCELLWYVIHYVIYYVIYTFDPDPRHARQNNMNIVTNLLKRQQQQPTKQLQQQLEWCPSHP